MHWWHWNEYRVAFTVKGDGFESAGQLWCVSVCVCVWSVWIQSNRRVGMLFTWNEFTNIQDWDD